MPSSKNNYYSPSALNHPVWIFVFLAFLVMGSLIGVNSYYDYKREVNLLEERLTAQAKVVEENLNANLATINLIFENIQQELAENHKHEKNYLNSYLKKQAKSFPGVRTFLITDGNGLCTHSNQDVLSGRDFSYRDYFTAPRDAADKNQLFMSPPFKTVLNTFVINISKPIFGNQGDFKGVIALSLSPEYFHSLLNSTIYAPDNRIALIHSDGIVFAAAPVNSNSIVGKNLLAPGSQFYRHVQGGKNNSIQSGHSAATGDTRTFAYVTHTPKYLRLNKHLVVVSSRNLDVVLQPWRMNTGIKLAVLFLFSCFIILGTKKILQRDAEKLRQAEYNRALLDSVQAHIAILDKNGVIVSVNDAWKEFAESNRTKSGQLPDNIDVGANYLAVCRDSSGEFSEQAAVALDGIRSVLNGSVRSFSLEYPCHSPDIQRWFIMTVEPLLTLDGGAVVTHIDISKRKDAENKLNKFRLLVESSNDAIYSKTLDGIVLTWNKSSERVYGYRADEMIGNNVSILLEQDRASEMKSLMNRVINGENVENYETVRIRKDGRKIYVSLTLSPISNEVGVISEVSMIARDITDRKLAEERLIANERFLRMLAEHIPGMVGYWTKELRCSFANSAYQEWFGKSQEEMNGIHIIDLMGEELFRKNEPFIRAALQGERQTFERALTKADGSTGYTWAHYIPDSSDGVVRGFFVLVSDVTELKEAEQLMRTAKDVAEAANRAKSDFLANMSHEIRTPMNAITGMAYLVQQTSLDARQSEYVARIRSAADTLLGIINDILDFSKIEAGKMELESVTFDVNELFSSVHNIVATRAEDKQLEVNFSIAPEIPLLLIGDQLRLRQVLNNLVSNAIKFTELGHVDIAVTTVETQRRTDRVALTFAISDTGIGMDSEQRERIFEPFSQADNSITRRYGGTGLGLAIVTRILELMGSRLDVVSTPGQGSNFTFTVEFGVPVKREKNLLIPPDDLRQMRVLVVDDNVESCRMLEAMLTTLLFVPTTVQSGAAALEELARAITTPGEEPYRLILLDWRMPGMDGLETARRIRNGALSVNPEIILISGYATADVQAIGQQLGIKLFMNKPFNLATLFNDILKTFGKEASSPVSPRHSGEVVAASPVQLRGTRVLLVEDDKVNQIVGQEILQRFGAEVVTMVSGESGVAAALDDHDFDMVFMDIQMPGMNGYEATTAIRQVKGELELPIIAMTAHAFREERERCMAAGMNDHIAKPIDPDQLYSVMLKWLPAEKVKKALILQSNSGEIPSRRIFPDCLPGIDIASVLHRCGGNEVLARDIIISFSDQQRTVFSTLGSAIENGSREQVKELVHTLKGLAGTIGAVSLATSVSELESALKEENTADVVHLPARMEQQLAEVFEAADILAALSGDTSAECDWIPLPNEELEPLMRVLRDSLSDNSLAAKKHFAQLGHYLHQPGRSEIQRYIARLDFKMALAALECAAQSRGIDLQRDI
jgi:PAS domain S-box-containing protein